MNEPYNGWTHERILEKLSDIIAIMDGTENYGSGDELFDIIVALKTEWNMNHDEIRKEQDVKKICAVCGKPVTAGMTDEEGSFYTHDGKCFEKFMDRNYGKHCWMEINDDGEDGYYIYKDDNVIGGYLGTGIFYTEWEDEEGETE